MKSKAPRERACLPAGRVFLLFCVKLNNNFIRTNTITISNLTPNTLITITNLLGEVVIKDVADSERKEIDVSRLAAGMYFVNKRKLVKE